MEPSHSPSLRLLSVVLAAIVILSLSSSLLRLPSQNTHTPLCNRFISWCNPTNKKSSFLVRDHSSSAPCHPLDPLTVSEINKARSILLSTPPFSSSSSSSLTIHSLTLCEPEKRLVLAWSPGDPLPPRKASVVLLLSRKPYVLTVDLSTNSVTHHPPPPSGYPTMSIEEMSSSTWAPLSDPAFNRTVQSRGVRLSDVACLPISPGWFAGEQSRRTIKVQCYSAESTANFYMRPIEGLTVLLDMDTMEVLSISDATPEIPIPKSTDTDYRYSVAGNKPYYAKPLKPISIEQPAGPSFEVVDDHTVRWAGWEVHIRADARAGAVVSVARFRDPESGEWRSVMYKGMVSELFVPYMDTSDAWYFKTYMDAGEYGFGLQAMPLVPLNDCPRNAYYMDGVFAAADGRAYVRERMVCLFESYGGDIGWRHSECPITGMQVLFYYLYEHFLIH